MIDPHDRNRRPDERLAAAAAALLRDDPVGVIFRGLDRKRIAERAELSRTTAHQAIPDHHEIVTRAIHLLLSVEPIEVHVQQVDDTIDIALEHAARELGPLAAVRLVASTHFEGLLADPSFAAVTFVQAATSGDPRLRWSAAETYQSTEDRYVRAFTKLVTEWGLEPQPYVTIASMTRSLTALIEGYGGRALVDPSVTADEVAGAIELILAASFKGSANTARQRLAATRSRVTTEQILSTASQVADRLGLATTVAHVEEELGVERGFLGERYPSVDTLTTAFWHEFATTTFELQLRASTGGLDRTGRARRAMRALAGEVAEHRGMARLYVAGWLDASVAPVSRQTRDPFAIALRTVTTGSAADHRRRSVRAVQALMLAVLSEAPPTERTRGRVLDMAVDVAMRELG